MGFYKWAPYVSVAQRKAKAAKQIEKESKKGNVYYPIVIEGRTISKSFWGKAWCTHLESYSDYSNRLPRGRTYARNGSIIDFKVKQGSIESLVMGSKLYKVTITIKAMEKDIWKQLTATCAGKISSLIELLQGQFSQHVMEILTQPKNGLFPKPHEIEMRCSCPDYADMCKHVAAVLYGMGASLDHHPEWLFTLRHIDHLDLLVAIDTGQSLLGTPSDQNVLEEDLSTLFGIEIDTNYTPPLAVSEEEAESSLKHVATPISKEAKTSKASASKLTPNKKKSLPQDKEYISIFVEADTPKKPRKKASK